MASATFEDHPTDPDKVILRKPRYEDDDDIQEYKRPWVGLTDKEIEELRLKTNDAIATNYEIYKAIEAKLKEKNA